MLQPYVGDLQRLRGTMPQLLETKQLFSVGDEKAISEYVSTMADYGFLVSYK